MRRYYPGITLFKFIGSILVVIGHLQIFQFVNEQNESFAASARVLSAVVPCFYIISGFLAYQGWSNAENSYKYIARYLKWIIMIYGLFCLIYFADSIIPEFLAHGIGLNSIVSQSKKLFLAIFILGPYGPLWFIPPLIFGIIISYYFYSKKKLFLAIILAAAGYIAAQVISGTLRIVIKVSIGDSFLAHMRHLRMLELMMLEYFGNGLPFVLIGVIIGKHEDKFMQTNIWKFILFLVPPIILECVFLNYYFKQYNDNLTLLIFTPLPAGILLFYGVLRIKLKQIKKYHTPLNLFSIVIYFSHMLLIYVNLKLFNWQLTDMNVFQMILFACLTFAEGILITMLVIFFKNTSKSKRLSKA